ncbi:MAG: hypothetical protein NXI21_05965 [Alphaproteobacteria bacterium]|nr:hypothetical protein [Alphaproteobacteria bacterium]
MRYALTIVLMLLLLPSAADAPAGAQGVSEGARSPDRFMLTVEDSNARRRLETLLLAECLQVVGAEGLERLRRMRREEGLPAFSVGWCIRKGHMPWDLDGDWPR